MKKFTAIFALMALLVQINHLNAQCPGLIDVEIKLLNLGAFAGNPGFVLYDDNGNQILAGGPGTSSICLAEGCYVITGTNMNCSISTNSFFPSCDNFTVKGNGQVVSVGGGYSSGACATSFGCQGSTFTEDFCLQFGCTDNNFCNYDPNATVDDGSCTGTHGCTDPAACNYHFWADCSDDICCYDGDCFQITITDQSGNSMSDASYNLFGPSNYELFGGPDATVWNEKFCMTPGCYQLYFSNPGSTDFDISLGDLAGGTFISNDNFGSVFFTYGVEAGCTDPSACNYNPNAVCNADNCTYPGCTDPQACNYNSNAGCDDGSCEISTGAQVTISGTGVNYIILDENNQTLISGSFASLLSFFSNEVKTCLPFECLTVIVNGLNCQSIFGQNSLCDYFRLEVNGNEVFFVSAVNNSTSYQQTVCIIDGCTDPLACNYDPEAINDDGSCGYISGCTDPSMINYNPLASCNDGSCANSIFGCTNPAACNYNSAAQVDDGTCDIANTSVIIQITNNNSGAANPILVTIQNELGLLYANTISVGQSVNDELCLPIECLETGMTGFGPTDVAVIQTNSGSVPIVGGFGSSCLQTGCTDPAFCNYNPLANVDDGSCCLSDNCLALSIFDGGSETLNGLVYNILQNGSIVATGQSQSVDEFYGNQCLNDGCYQLEIIPNGAGNPVNWEINGVSSLPQSGIGAGVFDISVGGDFGCTDPLACNFLPLAICDDGSCFYGSDVRLRITNNPSSTALIIVSVSLTFNGPPIYTFFAMPNVNQHNFDMCLPNDCVFFTISGMGAGDSWQWGVLQNGNVFVSLQNTSSSGTNNVTNNSVCNQLGCTDIGACNFNGLANVDDGTCLYFCNMCSTLELLDQGSETLDGTLFNIYDSNMQLIQSGISHQIDEDYIGICTEEFGCYFLEIIASGSPGNPITWSLTIDNNTFSGTGPGLYAFSPSGTLGCTEENAANYNSDASCDDGSCIFPGCTDPDACNFDSLANQDDGSCTTGVDVYLGITNSAFSPGVVEFGVSNELGQLIIAGQVPAGGQEIAMCLPSGCNSITLTGFGEGDTYSFTTSSGFLISSGVYDGSVLLNHPVCLNTQGCTNPAACNFSPIAIIDDGSCNLLGLDILITSDDNMDVQYALLNATNDILVTGSVTDIQMFIDHVCLEPGCYHFLFVDSDGIVSAADLFLLEVNGTPIFEDLIGSFEELSFCISIGCVDPNACNFDVEAFFDDGSCIYNNDGCNDPAACNYEPGPNCNENCLYTPNASLNIVNGSTANVISYTIKNEALQVVYEGSVTTTTNIPLCLNPECYTVNVVGMQITNPVAVDFWELEFNGDFVSSGIGSAPNNDFCLYDGCTNPLACNYNPSADFDDGSCDDQTGLIVVLNFGANADGVFPQYSFISQGVQSLPENHFEVTSEPAGTIINYYCVEVGCLLFGASGLDAQDQISIFDFEGNLVGEINGADGSGSLSFCPGYGCTDPVACNYDVSAINDDGSCLYGSIGCTNQFACNYDPIAVCDDETCVFPGCIDPLACNFDPAAGCDDGSCLLQAILHINNFNPPVVTYNLFDSQFVQYLNGATPPNQSFTNLSTCMPFGCFTLDIHGLTSNDNWNITVGSAVVASGNSDGIFNICLVDGCTDLSACNFNPAAIHNDGSCTYGAGCNNPSACNFDPAALCDDGSCIVLQSDFDSNGVVNTADLLQFMAFFACSGSCAPFDLDQNGVVNTGDLLQMMAQFGQACP